MFIGLGLGICSPFSGASGPFTPALLNPTLWVAGPDYEGPTDGPDAGTTAGDWPGTPGALAKGGDSAPDIGATLNGLSTVEFVEANGDALYGGASSGYVGASGTIVLLTRPLAAAASGGAHSDPALVYLSAGALLTFSASGAQACIYDVGQKSATKACNTSATHMIVMRWNGTAVDVSVDNVWSAPTVCGSPVTLADTVTVSKNPGIAFQGQRMAEMMLFNTALSNAACTQLAAYFTEKWTVP